jgi:hypothetical protein
MERQKQLAENPGANRRAVNGTRFEAGGEIEPKIIREKAYTLPGGMSRNSAALQSHHSENKQRKGKRETKDTTQKKEIELHLCQKVIAANGMKIALSPALHCLSPARH